MSDSVQPTSDTQHDTSLICVVGVPRSGTTFLQNLIATHPQVTTCPETALFIRLAQYWLYQRNLPPIGLKSSLRLWPKDEVDSFLTSVFKNQPWLRPSPLTELAGQSRMTKEIADAYFRSAMSEPERKFYLEKTPSHIHFVPTIREIYPEAKILHIVRNPFDTARSYQGMLHQQGKPPRSGFEFSRMWNSSVQEAKHHSLMTIRYEDLVEDQVREMKKVGEWLGLDFSVNELDRHSEQADKTVLTTETWKGNNRKSRPDPSRKQELSLADRSVLSFCCPSGMKHWGYSVELPAPKNIWFLAQQAFRYGCMRFKSCVRRPV